MESYRLGLDGQGSDLAAYNGRLLTTHAAGNLTMREFASLHGVSACTLYYWRRRLAALDDGPEPATGKLVAVDVVGGAREPDSTTLLASLARFERRAVSLPAQSWPFQAEAQPSSAP